MSWLILSLIDRSQQVSKMQAKQVTVILIQPVHLVLSLSYFMQHCTISHMMIRSVFYIWYSTVYCHSPIHTHVFIQCIYGLHFSSMRGSWGFSILLKDTSARRWGRLGPPTFWLEDDLALPPQPHDKLLCLFRIQYYFLKSLNYTLREKCRLLSDVCWQ